MLHETSISDRPTCHDGATAHMAARAAAIDATAAAAVAAHVVVSDIIAAAAADTHRRLLLLDKTLAHVTLHVHRLHAMMH